MNIVNISEFRNKPRNSNTKENQKNVLEKKWENDGWAILCDIEDLLDAIASMEYLSTWDIYDTYYLDKNKICQGINLHMIYQKYRGTISYPALHNILWSRCSKNGIDILKNFLFLISLPYLEE